MTFQNKKLDKIRIILLFIFSNILWPGIGILLNIINKKSIYDDLLLYTLVANIFFLMIIISHIDHITVKDKEIIFYFIFFKIKFNISELRVKEKNKINQFTRYKRLIIRGKRYWPSIKIDSDEWDSEYLEFKDFLISNNLLKRKL